MCGLLCQAGVDPGRSEELSACVAATSLVQQHANGVNMQQNLGRLAMAQQRLRAALMRGGTSKTLVLHRADLPDNPDQIFRVACDRLDQRRYVRP